MRRNLSILVAVLSLTAASCTTPLPADKGLIGGKAATIEKKVLEDKLKGGWAGQVIGCTYGGPTEFRWNGTMIDDYNSIPWNDNQILWWYENSPGLYDDVYMDLTFVETFEKHGFDAADSLHALAFANAGYPLWHANQAARYNILNGIMPPASGHWKNNPHADDIDFQIEADFAGLMSPGMVSSAVQIANRIGHIMNFGDGVYGGVYVAAMYSLAYVYNDVNMIVSEALKTIPAESEFYRCMDDVIRWHKEFPDDWKRTWFEAQKKWASDRGCPDGVFVPFNIDAKINAAYIIIGLLYGNGDFGATIDIATRCGQDSDCNPANAAGILGTMIGYSAIPDTWKNGLKKVEDMNFRYTDMSLNKVYEMGYRHAIEMIARNGGREEGGSYVIPVQTPEPLPLEVAFEGLYPVERKRMNVSLSARNPEIMLNINGCGFVVTGSAQKESSVADTILTLDVLADGQLLETVEMPTRTLSRRHDVAWNYELPEGAHVIMLKARTIPEGYRIYAGDAVVYSSSDPGKKIYH